MSNGAMYIILFTSATPDNETTPLECVLPGPQLTFHNVVSLADVRIPLVTKLLKKIDNINDIKTNIFKQGYSKELDDLMIDYYNQLNKLDIISGIQALRFLYRGMGLL